MSIEPLGARVLTLTGEVRDLQQRFTALEARFSAQEDRITAVLALIVRIAERVGEPAR